MYCRAAPARQGLQRSLFDKEPESGRLTTILPHGEFELRFFSVDVPTSPPSRNLVSQDENERRFGPFVCRDIGRRKQD
jgi:hypothetical protein